MNLTPIPAPAVRKALLSELDAIYLMGFDVWGGGEAVEVYLEGCRTSRKYQQGTWHVLVSGQRSGVEALLSSLIVYELPEKNAWGIGSIATPPECRKNGYASRLVEEVLHQLNVTGTERVFLFSDIDSKFYEKLGFAALSGVFQGSRETVCMVRGVDPVQLEAEPGFNPPGYF